MISPGWRYGEVAAVSRAAEGVGLARQMMSADLVAHEDGPARGTRCILLQNDRISLEVIVDRGMDIGRARVEQLPIAWASPTGIVAPHCWSSAAANFSAASTVDC